MIDNFHPEWWRAESPETAGLRSEEERISPVPFWALIGFTFILLISPQTYLPALGVLRPALLVAAVGIAAYLVDQMVHRRPLMKMTREMRITIWLVSWAVVTLPLSLWFMGSLSVLLDLYFKTLIVFWLLYTTVNNLARLRQICWGLTLMGIPIALSAVKSYLSGGLLPKVERIAGYESGLTANPNDLALMLNLIFPLTMALLMIVRKPLIRYALMGILFLDILAVVATFSRGGFVTLAALYMIYLWKFRHRKERKWLVAVLLIALVCAPLLPQAYWNRLSTTVRSSTDTTGSSQERLQAMTTAMIFVVKHPIVGGGLGMSTLVMTKEGGTFWTDVHNAYLQYAVDLGLPGLVLFFMLLTACLQSAKMVQRQTARAPGLEELFFLAQGIQISLMAFMVAAMFHPVAYHLYFYYMAGLAVALRSVYQAEQARSMRTAASDAHREISDSKWIGVGHAVG